MKLLLVFSISACSFTAFAQVNQEEILKNKLEQLYKGGVDTEKWRIQALPQPLGELYYQDALAQAPRQPGIYSLPQDRMPCIVPDTRSIVSIPNAFPNVSVPFITTIPNAYRGPVLKNSTKK